MLSFWCLTWYSLSTAGGKTPDIQQTYKHVCIKSELRPSSLFNRTNIIHKTISLSRRINILCIYVRLGCFFYNIAAHRVICDSYHLTDKVENTFWPHHFNEDGGLGPKTYMLYVVYMSSCYTICVWVL
jgi:hypothetical protein